MTTHPFKASVLLLTVGVLCAGASWLCAGAQDRGPDNLSRWEPASSSGDPISLLEATRLTLAHDPGLRQARERALQQLGSVQASKGVFDLAWRGGFTLNLETTLLTDSMRQGEADRRTLARAVAIAFEDAAEDLDDWLSDPNREFPDCRDLIELGEDYPEVVFDIELPSGEVITLSAFIQRYCEYDADHLMQLLVIARALGVDTSAIEERLAEITNIEEEVLDLLRLVASSARQTLRQMGVEPEFNDRTSLTLDLGLSKAYRSGIVFSPGLRLDAVRDDYRGKPLAAGSGGRGFPETITSNFSLALSVPLAKGRGKVSTAAAERASRHTYRAALYSEAHAAATSVRTTAEAYWRLLAAQERVELQRRSASTSARLLEIGQGLVAADELASADLVQVEARVSETRAQLMQARLELLQARLELADAVGAVVRRMEDAPLAADSWPELPAANGLATWGAGELAGIAVTRRSDAVAARWREQSARVLADGARADLRRRADLSLTVSYRGLDELEWERGESMSNVEDLFGAYGDALFGYSPGPSAKLGFTFELPFGNNQAEGRYEQARSTFHQSHIRLVNLERIIGTRVEELKHTLGRAILEIERRQASTAAYERLLEAEIEKFESGLTTVVDVILTEDEVISAQLGLLATRESAALLLTELRYELGALVLSRVDEDRVVVEEVWPALPTQSRQAMR
jgi:outer membrane protein TolC